MPLARQYITLVRRQIRLLRTVLVLAGGWLHYRSTLEICGQGTSSPNSPSRHTKLTRFIFIRQISHFSSEFSMPKRKSTHENAGAVPAESRRRSNRLQQLEGDGLEVAPSKETKRPTNPPTKKNANKLGHAVKKVNFAPKCSTGRVVTYPTLPLNLFLVETLLMVPLITRYVGNSKG